MVLRWTSAATHADGRNTLALRAWKRRSIRASGRTRDQRVPRGVEPLPLSWSARRPTRRAVVVVVIEPRSAGRASMCRWQPIRSAAVDGADRRGTQAVRPHGCTSPSPRQRPRSRPIVRPVSDAPTGQWNRAQGCGVRAATLGWASHPSPQPQRGCGLERGPPDESAMPSQRCLSPTHGKGFDVSLATGPFGGRGWGGPQGVRDYGTDVRIGDRSRCRYRPRPR
jgi:hypothetical protein